MISRSLVSSWDYPYKHSQEQGHIVTSPFSFLSLSSSSVSYKAQVLPCLLFNTNLLSYFLVSSSVIQYCLDQFPFSSVVGGSLDLGVPVLSVSSCFVFIAWTYCGCSLALSPPSCPSAWHVPSAAPAGDVLSNCYRAPTCHSLCLCGYMLSVYIS